jgi:hypothetical protein
MLEVGCRDVEGVARRTRQKSVYCEKKSEETPSTQRVWEV